MYQIGDLYSYEGIRSTAVWNESGDTEGSLNKGDMFVLLSCSDEHVNRHKADGAKPIISCRALLVSGRFVQFACRDNEIVRVEKEK